MEESATWMRWVSGLVEERSKREYREESESVRSIYLLLGGIWVMWDRQEKIAINSAVKTDAILRMRWNTIEPAFQL